MQAQEPHWIRTRERGVEIRVRLSPRASRNGVHGFYGDRLRVRLTAPPVGGAANQALVRFLSGLAGLPPSSGTVVRGVRDRSKTVLLLCQSPQEVMARLETAIAKA